MDGSTIVKDTTTGELSAVKATASTVGVVKPDGDTITIDADGTIHGADQTDLSDYETSWSGTMEEWEALTDEEKEAYEIVSITDDGDTSEVVDAVTDGDMRVPTSNAVYDAIQGLNTKRLTVAASGSETTNTIDLTQLGLNPNMDYEIIVTGITGKHIKTIMRTTITDYTGTSQTWGWCFGNAILIEGDSAMSMSCSSSGVLTVTGGIIYGNIYVACKPFINGIPQ